MLLAKYGTVKNMITQKRLYVTLPQANGRQDLAVYFYFVLAL